ncbi:3-phosphoinositide-dependent protein kinase 1 [Tanacetum coccineum]
MVAGCLDEHLNKNEVAGVSLGFPANLAMSSSLGFSSGMSFRRISEVRTEEQLVESVCTTTGAKKDSLRQNLEPRENLLLTSDGHIKIADFGSVKPMQDSRITVVPNAASGSNMANNEDSAVELKKLKKGNEEDGGVHPCWYWRTFQAIGPCSNDPL